MRQVLTSLGLSPTGAGLATISAEVEPGRFHDLFGVTATEIAPRPAGERDFGTSGGYVSPKLTIPSTLTQYVQSISAVTPHTYF